MGAARQRDPKIRRTFVRSRCGRRDLPTNGLHPHRGGMTTAQWQGLIVAIVALSAFAVVKYIQHKRKNKR